jgi:2-dehydro-3-deoxyphosphogluconate aldolase/(4S)-4-hydroxy-2-oxoglutarate aldolase
MASESATAPAVFAAFEEAHIIPVIDLPSPDLAEPLAEALLAAGGRVAELTLRSDSAHASLVAFVAAAERLGAGPSGHPLLVGAGTVLNAADLVRAADAGASFAISPGSTPALRSVAIDADVPWIPGIASASEAMVVLEEGIRLAKFFPAETLGGVNAVKALLAPLAFHGLQLMPTGGITAASAPTYLAVDGIVAVGGSWMVARDLLVEGQWSTVTSRMREALAS